MKTIKGNLVLAKDTVFDESIVVKGNIFGKDGERFNLIVKGNISARDISAWNISARDISAWNISAWDISARNISYHAFCIAYHNIKCKSIKGGRNKSFHKCLDGKITIKKSRN